MLGQRKLRTFSCPGPWRPSVPPLMNPLSPQPRPPPALLAGVGSALAPPAVEVRGWFAGPSGDLVGFLGSAILLLSSLGGQDGVVSLGLWRMRWVLTGLLTIWLWLICFWMNEYSSRVSGIISILNVQIFMTSS